MLFATISHVPCVPLEPEPLDPAGGAVVLPGLLEAPGAATPKRPIPCVVDTGAPSPACADRAGVVVGTPGTLGGGACEVAAETGPGVDVGEAAVAAGAAAAAAGAAAAAAAGAAAVAADGAAAVAAAGGDGAPIKPPALGADSPPPATTLVTVPPVSPGNAGTEPAAEVAGFGAGAGVGDGRGGDGGGGGAGCFLGGGDGAPKLDGACLLAAASAAEEGTALELWASGDGAGAGGACAPGHRCCTHCATDFMPFAT